MNEEETRKSLEHEDYYENCDVVLPEGYHDNADARKSDKKLAEISAEITEGIIAQGVLLAKKPERENQEMTELLETLDDLIRFNASKQQIANAVDKQIAKTSEDQIPEKLATAELYIQELVQKAYVLIEGYILIKTKLGTKDRFDEEEIINVLQYCWSKIISKENKLFMLEKMRALIQKEDNEEIKRKLFKALVISMTRSLDQNHSQAISVKALLENDNYSDIRKKLLEKTKDPDREKSLAALIALDMIETNFLTDPEAWEEISLHPNVDSYAEKVFKEYEKPFKSEDPVIRRAWEEILRPRLLAWGEILYSDDFLLPKRKPAI